MQIHELNNFTGTLGSGSYVVVDDGTDTGKVSTQNIVGPVEGQIRELDEFLNARIDNIIAGGAAPSEAEIIDARLGADGGVYPSLGDAIRGQVDEINESIESLGATPYFGIRKDGGHIGSSVWQYTDSNNYKVIAIPVIPGQNINILTVGTNSTIIAFVKSYTKPTDGGSIDYSSEAGYTARISVVPSIESNYTVPSDVHYLVYELVNNSVTVAPYRLEIDGYDLTKAVSSNIANVSNEAKDFYDEIAAREQETIQYSIINNKSIQLDGNVITTTGVITSNIDVTDYKYISFTTRVGYRNLAIAFYDANNQYIMGLGSATDGYTDYTNKVIKVPVNASYMIVAGANATRLSSVIGLGDWLSKDAENVEKLITAYPVSNIYQDVEFTQEADKVINSSGAIVSAGGSTSYVISGYVDISGYEQIYIDASNNYGNALYAFYDASYNVLKIGPIAENVGTNTVLSNEMLIVPLNAKYICVAGRVGSSVTYVLPAIRYFDTYKSGRWSNLKWCCVGDSLTEKNANATKKYFDYVQNYTGIEVVNMGVSGTGYARTQGSGTAFYQRISDVPLDSDVVTIFGSFNDLGAGLPVGDASDSGTTTLAGCINTTIDNLQAIIPLVNLGIVAPTPWETTKPATSGNAYNYVEMLKQICELRSIPFLDLWRESNLRPWDADFRAAAYTHDGGSGVHPDENGHKLIAPRFEAFLEKLLLH